MKISVVGIGKVGSTVSFVLAKDGLANELVLYNRTREIAQAEAIDIQQAIALTNHRLLVRDGDIKDTAESDIIVIAVSVPMPKEMSSRDNLLLGNTKIMQSLIPFETQLNEIETTAFQDCARTVQQQIQLVSHQ